MAIEKDGEFKKWLEDQPDVMKTDRGFALFPCDTSIKEVDRDEQTLVVTISTKTKDRQKDIMEARGAVLENFRRNPVVLWAHNYHLPPFAKALWLKTEDDRIVGKPKFAKTLLGQELFYLYSEGFLNAWSIGFIPITWERIEEEEPCEEGMPCAGPGYRITEWELLEFSGVPVPANPEALTHSIMERRVTSPVLLKAFGQPEEAKKVIPYKQTPKAPEDEAWDAGGEVKEADVDDLKIMCLWYDEEKPDVKGSYKGPHHKAAGQHPVVWRGVAAGMAVLLGARGGFNVPEKDRKPMYKHLSKHYKEFEKEPPEFKQYSESEAIAWALAEGTINLNGPPEPPDPDKQIPYDCTCLTCGHQFKFTMSPKEAEDISLVCPQCGGPGAIDQRQPIETADAKPEPEETENTIRIRVRNPKDFVEDSFRTITISEKKGIKAVIGKLKEDPDGPTKVQSYIFDKSCDNKPNKCDWTVEEAQKWVDEHHEDTNTVLARSEAARDGSLEILFTGNTVQEVVEAHICGILTMEEAVQAFTSIYEIMLGQKEGRVLSEKNRKLLREVISGLKSLNKTIPKTVKPLEELLEATEPPEKGADEAESSLEKDKETSDEGSGDPKPIEEEPDNKIVLILNKGEENQDEDNKAGAPAISAEFAEKMVGIFGERLRREIRRLQGRIDE